MPTPTEEFLARACQRSFLSLWSHPHIHKDSRPVPHEVCDLLVVFGDDVIVFSDKSVEFPSNTSVEVGWARWYRKAIVASTNQLYGAMRWLRDHQDRIYADANCKKRLPVLLPSPERIRFHLISVAWGAGAACQQFFGPAATPSLVLDTALVGDAHLGMPFHIGRVDSNRPFVHIFDSASLGFVMAEIDTISDFVTYLQKRAELLTNPTRAIMANGEEELLAAYLTTLDENGQHSFLTKEMTGLDDLLFAAGGWHAYVTSTERRRKKEADAVSGAWDAMIEHLIQGVFGGPPDADAINRERVLRLMASENRLQRRFLAHRFREFMRKHGTISGRRYAAHVAYTENLSGRAYVLLIMPREAGQNDSEYLNLRANLLQTYCRVLAVELPEATDIIGLGIGPPDIAPADAAVCLVKPSELAEADVANARDVQARLRILLNFRTRVNRVRELEYPTLPADVVAKAANSAIASGGPAVEPSVGSGES